MEVVLWTTAVTTSCAWRSSDGIGGGLAGTRVLIPELPREICSALILGLGLTRVCKIAVLLRLNGLWTGESDAAAGQEIHGAAGEQMAVLGIAVLILAGLRGIALSLAGDPPPLAAPFSATPIRLSPCCFHWPAVSPWLPRDYRRRTPRISSATTPG
ncbi:hypothetical protein ACTAF0_09055 [Streptomyces murinus]|uniref:hypothetical protein n=1 Tax=Streptomyces murinus TaxID=33900 RepID=UPI003F4469A1